MYRKNVCAVIFNENGHYLGCTRRGSKALQCVQGGIEDGDDDLVVAALREIGEEIGLSRHDVAFVTELQPPNGDPQRFRYDLRPTANLRRYGFVGQDQRLLLFYAHSSVLQKINLTPSPECGVPAEFDAVAWVPMERLVNECPREKQHIFRDMAAIAPPIAAEYLAARGPTSKTTEADVADRSHV